MYSAAQAANGRLSSWKRSRWIAVAIAAIQTNAMIGGKPAATRSHGAPNSTRAKK